MPTEADTCPTLVVHKLQAAGWDCEPHSITDWPVLSVGKGFVRKPQMRVDYPLPQNAWDDDSIRVEIGSAFV